MSTLCAHEHLCPAVARYHSSFQTMWQQVCGEQGFEADAFSATNFQDLFQHIGFEHGADMFPNFGVEDIPAMGNLDWNSVG